WSSPVNAIYRSQLVARAVDLVQLFPAAAYAKNGADIRLAVDTVEDLYLMPDITHVVIVAGDSDYVPLAQRCRRLGRNVAARGGAAAPGRPPTSGAAGSARGRGARPTPTPRPAPPSAPPRRPRRPPRTPTTRRPPRTRARRRPACCSAPCSWATAGTASGCTPRP